MRENWFGDEVVLVEHLYTIVVFCFVFCLLVGLFVLCVCVCLFLSFSNPSVLKCKC